jgi:hypothetical protein
MNSNQPPASGLVVIARDTTGRIITRITCTRSRDLVGAMHTARGVLRLKAEAARAQVHYQAHQTSDYRGKPLAALSRDDLPIEQTR